MALLGTGMGLIVSQLGNVAQSSVGATQRGEVGGLQYTAQQLGSSLGVAFIGAIVLSSLTTTLVDKIESDPQISEQVQQEVSVEVADGVPFVTSAQVRSSVEAAGYDATTTDALVKSYEESQLQALKLGLLVVMLLVIAPFPFTRRLPAERPRAEDEARPDPAEVG
jgi:hypothetical protein